MLYIGMHKHEDPPCWYTQRLVSAPKTRLQLDTAQSLHPYLPDVLLCAYALELLLGVTRQHINLMEYLT